ncbi:MAG TPA: GtrA family protein [Candidatus Paceibacterota bacterium]|nr:GtrA family protein [Candidatus Paceibacterota bacterium]
MRSLITFFNSSTFVRYVFSGGTAAAIDVALLYLLATVFGVYYLAAATFAMTVSFIARFLLQKYVTFRDQDKEDEKRQFGYYSVLYLLSLSATNALLYLFVEKLHLWLLASQVVSILLVACACYFIYKLFIFPRPGAADARAAVTNNL